MQVLWGSAFGQMTYGIYVLSTAFKNTLNGMIASWVSQISNTPPLIMVAVYHNPYTRLLWHPFTRKYRLALRQA